ncbi:MAG: hypothetical protein ACYS0G_08835 [Planctomycetota bacterium]|jgi:hypothetical protein
MARIGVNLLPSGALAATAVLAGCLERRETITVEPDGTVVIEATFTTESEAEFTEGDALPAAAGGWFVDESMEVDDEGDMEFTLTAEAEFPPDEALPASFAVPGDADADLYLQFPTTVIMEDRPDGTWYHFHRRYPARRWAQIEALRERLVDERLEELEDKPEDEYTREDRVFVLQAYVEFEVAKMLTFARGAFLEVTPDAPQDGWLRVRAAVHAYKVAIDYQRIAELMEIEDEQERSKALDEEGRQWEDKAVRTLKDALREHCGYGGRQLSDFVRHLERKRRFHEITGGLGDDAFEITVVLPGRIQGSNADETAGDRATWKFSGHRFRDRDLELMASSRLGFDELLPE